MICRLIGTASDAGETVYFSVSRILDPSATRPLLLPLPPLRRTAPRLRSDPEITGAECEGTAWHKGMKIRGQHTLRCRRSGTGPVSFRLDTTHAACSETLPELGAAPWQESCSRADAAVEPVLPFLRPPAPPGG